MRGRFRSSGRGGGITTCRPEEAADHIDRLRRRGYAVRVETPEKDVVKLYWGSMAPKPVHDPRVDEILADIAAGKYDRTEEQPCR